ncbi:spindle and kinetochore-associated protein 2 [Lates japonicus]|uniref:Spindle and kinetochore-associated protein 2 n=1 Tax=Lates japonicus TaxID=270547 RepID=A0AAD3RLS1_LATJO|nr:spindle and kinetochore-associated protein 2 [Lates japonicus]
MEEDGDGVSPPRCLRTSQISPPYHQTSTSHSSSRALFFRCSVVLSLKMFVPEEPISNIRSFPEVSCRTIRPDLPLPSSASPEIVLLFQLPLNSFEAAASTRNEYLSHSVSTDGSLESSRPHVSPTARQARLTRAHCTQTLSERRRVQSISSRLRRSLQFVIVQPLMESEQESAELLASAVSQTTTEVSSAVAALGQQQPLSGEYQGLSEAMLEAVPLSIRSNIKLADLNMFYQQLQQHLSKTNSESLSVQKMKHLKMSDTKLKILQHLSLVELDRKGCVHLVV